MQPMKRMEALPLCCYMGIKQSPRYNVKPQKRHKTVNNDSICIKIGEKSTCIWKVNMMLTTFLRRESGGGGKEWKTFNCIYPFATWEFWTMWMYYLIKVNKITPLQKTNKQTNKLGNEIIEDFKLQSNSCIFA